MSHGGTGKLRSIVSGSPRPLVNRPASKTLPTGDALSAPFGRIDIEADAALTLAGGPPPYHAHDFTLLAAPVPAGYLGTVALWRPRNGASQMGS